MNPAIKRKWTDALRSGAYKQGRGRLKDSNQFNGEDKYCCLGVLVDLYCKEYNTTFGEVCQYGLEVLPQRVIEWAELDNDSDSSNPVVDRRALAEWNDVQQSTFDEIADLIERNL